MSKIKAIAEFRILAELGSGNSGIVYLVQNEGNGRRARRDRSPPDGYASDLQRHGRPLRRRAIARRRRAGRRRVVPRRGRRLRSGGRPIAIENR